MTMLIGNDSWCSGGLAMQALFVHWFIYSSVQSCDRGAIAITPILQMGS